jgi:hypothetical protein
MIEIFIAREASRGYNNESHFGSHAPTRLRHFKNYASYTGYPDGQANCLTFQRKLHRDVTVVQLSTRVVDSSMCIEHIINPVWYRVKLIIIWKIEGSTKPISRTRCVKSDFNEGVRLVSADQPVA